MSPLFTLDPHDKGGQVLQASKPLHLLDKAVDLADPRLRVAIEDKDEGVTPGGNLCSKNQKKMLFLARISL